MDNQFSQDIEHGRSADLALELRKRILVLGGAMGTQIQGLGLSEADFRGDRYASHPGDLAGDNDILCLTRPDAISEIHNSYLAAGADIISTNTFNATPMGQAEYGVEAGVYDLNVAGARLAADPARRWTAKDPKRPRFVAGVLGPTSKSCGISSDMDDPGRREVSFDQMAAAYRAQAEGLIDGGVDILLIETVFDTLNAKAALFAIMSLLDERRLGLPIWVSATVSDSGGRMLAGQTVEAFWTSISHASPLCVGLNCGLGADALRPHVMALGAVAETMVSVHPNAGLPNEFGEYEESPERMAAAIGELAGSGLVNIVGGCCGTTPAHISAIAEAVAGLTPRRVPALAAYSRLSGLDMLEIGPDSLFINVGERTNLTGSARFARLIKEGLREDALQVARDQIRGGAQIIDVNMDDPLLDPAAEMTCFLNLIASDPEIARVPVMIDSAQWEVIEAGLKCIQGKGVVNSISLKDGEDEFVRRARLVREYGAAAVVMAFDESGQAESYKRKVEICTRAYRILADRVGFPPQDIILDPAIFAVGTGLAGQGDYAVAFIEACRTLKGTLPHCLVSGGVSNVSFAFRGNNTIREAMHSVFLYHAIRAGMDMGIVNAGQLGVYAEIPEEIRGPVEDLLLGRSPDALVRVMDLAQRAKRAGRTGPVTREPDWRDRPVGERLEHALVNGVSDFIEKDSLEALEALGTPLNVIEGPLMSGMKIVGDLFGSGMMFLPQVVRSARVMKKAVSALEPHMESRRGPAAGGRGDTAAGGRPAPGRTGPEARPGARAASRARAKVLLATVKGDVHDIGKNIVAVVLGCNNYDVVDLGAMIAAGEIISTVKRESPDVIGLSGLITPSLGQMCNVAGELRREGITTPLLIGGATTSPAHTALKIDPVYDGPVLRVRDASRVVTAIDSLIGKEARSIRDIKAEHARVRNQVAERRGGIKLLSLKEARLRKPVIEWKNYVPKRPRDLGVTAFEDYPLADVVPFIDWTPLFRLWKLTGRYPDILSQERFGEEAQKLLADAKALLERIVNEKLLSARAVVGLFPAASLGDDIEVYASNDRARPLGVIQCLREQRESPEGKPSLCLSDFVAPKDGGIEDYAGAFVVSAGFGCRELAGRFEQGGDDYSAIMTKALADRLAEALAEQLHLRVRREIWGYAPDESLDLEGIAAEEFIGIRPAPGYPACPDHTAKGMLFDLLDAEARIGVSLTESFAVRPAASVAGWYLAHPESRYFNVGRIGRDQVADYARRKGISVAEAQSWLSQNLAEETAI